MASREDSIEIIHLFAGIHVYTFPHSEQVKWILPSTNSSFRHHFVIIIIIIIINIDFSISLLSCHSAHWNFIPFSCLQERKTWLKNTRKARFSRDSNELRLFKVSRLFIYLFILLYFLLLTSQLSKESSIWSLLC